MVRVVLILILTSFFVVGCDSGESGRNQDETGYLDSIRRDGRELVVLVRNAPTVYFFDRDREAGFEYELAREFAHSVDLSLKVKVLDSTTAVLRALREGEGHIAAAGLSQTVDRDNDLLPGPSYQQIRQQVVCRRGGRRPQGVTDLVETNIAVVAHSSYVGQLRRIKQTHPALSWHEVEDLSTEDLLEKVWSQEIDCTVADSNIVAINRRYHPELVVTFDLSDPEPLVWYIESSGRELKAEVSEWLERFRGSGGLDRLTERYYGFTDVFDYVDTRRYVQRIAKRLPNYRDMFKQAAAKYELPWTLLAAQSYQESHWNRKAKSPTGVRGIMMLTQATAKEVGVTNRLDAEQNIYGGAKYLAKLRARLPESIQEPDRTWLALAAYNIGMGHLKDARSLAQQLGKNPDSWHDLKTVLPLLAKKQYYKKLKYGYARGGEPVRYVTRIRDFEDILLQHINNGGV